jgi:hypothetical protein
MKIFLLHPNDHAESGPWQSTHWDWIVDLGWAGQPAYADLANRLRCKTSSIRNILDHKNHLLRLQGLWKPGLGTLVDDAGVDWWDLFFPLPYTGFEEGMLAACLAEQIPCNAEVAASRPHFIVHALSKLLGREVKTFAPENNSLLTRYARAASTFRPRQILEIALDKWDTDYRLRRHISPLAKPSTEPVVLLPSSYVNVSRSQVAYARMLPQQRFLLVVTRHNGSLVDLPANVELRSLASYAPQPFLPATEREYIHLLESWRKLQPQLSENSRALALTIKLGVFNGFPAFLKNGLRIRDAWQSVLSREPVQAVLSGDENNPLTRLPTLLARAKAIQTVVCEHGALNLGFALRPPVSAICLVQGEMSHDYMTTFCGLQHDHILIGAAAAKKVPLESKEKRDRIVYFSTAYEELSGRTERFYLEILPELCSLASKTGRRVIIKLHPFESLRERKRMVARLLSPGHQSLIELREGSPTPDLFDRAWFSLTVDSSVAVECTLQAVPCFMCRWLDVSWYEYGTQFAKFSAGRILHAPEEIAGIPNLLQNFDAGSAITERLVTPIRPDDLKAILSGPLPS